MLILADVRALFVGGEAVVVVVVDVDDKVFLPLSSESSFEMSVELEDGYDDDDVDEVLTPSIEFEFISFI